MKALVLCAGYATRLYPLTRDTPKPLLEVDGLGILDHIVTRVSLMDISDLCVISNAKFYPHFKAWADRAGYRRPKITVLDDQTTTEETRRGSMGDVHFALQQTKWRDGFLLINGDNLCTFSFKPALNTYRQRGNTILTYDVGSKETAKLYGVPVVDGNGRVTDFVEKPKEPHSSLVSIGVYLYGPETVDLLDEYVRTAPSVDKTGDFVGWLARKTTVYAHPVRSGEGLWFDIGTLDQLEEARRTITALHTRPHLSNADVAAAIRRAVGAFSSGNGRSAESPTSKLSETRTFLDVVRLLGRPEAETRLLAVHILGALGIAAAIPWLLDSLDDHGPAGRSGMNVSNDALAALVKLGYASTSKAALDKATLSGFQGA